MKFANCDNDLCCVELDNILIEALLLLEYFVQLSAINERHYEVETGIRLEQIVHTAKERVISFK